MLAVVPAALIFTAWDVVAIRARWWHFDPRYVSRRAVARAACRVEELLFFLVVPVCAILTFEAVRRLRPEWLAGDERAADEACARKNCCDLYRGQPVRRWCLAVAADLWLWRTTLVRRRVFWVSYAIVVAFQLVVNGILTGLSIVRYDPRASSAGGCSGPRSRTSASASRWYWSRCRPGCGWADGSGPTPSALARVPGKWVTC